MRLTKLTWGGLVCLAVAITTVGAWFLWLQTRKNKPVYLPVPLTIGRVHIPEFRINLSGPYEISIEAKKRIPFDTLNCLLGMSMQPEQCNQQPVVHATWAVTSDGTVIAKGTSDAERGGGWADDTITKQIGSFEGFAQKMQIGWFQSVEPTDFGSDVTAHEEHSQVWFPFPHRNPKLTSVAAR